MTPERFHAITDKYSKLRVGVVGDFCLDRYLEIDPAKTEISIETGLPVYNVSNVRSQPGGAGTIVNNLAALGLGAIRPVGFAGEDGEGYELSRALAAIPGVQCNHFFQTHERCTFTYCKPLILEAGKAPRELNRFDQKNWTPTPATLSARLSAALNSLANEVDALILLSQVDEPETGVLTNMVLEAVRKIAILKPKMVILADSRRGLAEFPPVIFKMNAKELSVITGISAAADLTTIIQTAKQLAFHNNHSVFVTLAERGIVGASPEGQTAHVPALPVHEEIDIVGAGDSVTANLTAALAAGAMLGEALILANAAASIVIHQLGTTGSASIDQLRSSVFQR